MLESQLTSTRQDGTVQNHLQVRRSSDHDRDHSAAAALSSLARVSTPTAVPFAENSHANYRAPDTASTPLPILSSTSADGIENETYEWDEGGDEKELGTDAMGAASTRDYKPGFFGMHRHYGINSRRLLDHVLHGGNQTRHLFLNTSVSNRFRNTICQSASKTLPFRSNPRQRCRRSSPPSSKNRRPSRRSLLQVRPYSLPMAARTFFPGPIRKPLDDSTRIIER